MSIFLGLLLPALTAVAIRFSKTTDNNVKILISLLVATVVGVPLWFGLGREYKLESILEYVAGLYGIGQMAYQYKKANTFTDNHE